MNTIRYEFIESSAFWEFFMEARKILFEENFDFNIQEVMTEEEKHRIRNLYIKDPKEYFLVAKLNDDIIGWSYGIQRTNTDFYMVNSAVFPDYRRKGIYTAMLKIAVDKIQEFGFQRIFSCHKMSNNQVIIPKLKFGFVISGMEITDVFGALVQLSYYTNHTRRDLFDIRVGMRKPTEEDLKLIK